MSKVYVLTVINSESKGCSPELTLEEFQDCPKYIQDFYTLKTLLK